MPETSKETPLTVYTAIGNSDDKLSQKTWSRFCRDFTAEVQRNSLRIFGAWHSLPNARYQNAAICLQILPSQVAGLRAKLEDLRVKYGQDSIAWTYAGREDFIQGATQASQGT